MTDGTQGPHTIQTSYGEYGTVWTGPIPQYNAAHHRAYDVLRQLEDWQDSGYNPRLQASSDGWWLMLDSHGPFIDNQSDRPMSDLRLRLVTPCFSTIAEAVTAAAEVVP